jgi:hypothetical protein
LTTAARKRLAIRSSVSKTYAPGEIIEQARAIITTFMSSDNAGFIDPKINRKIYCDLGWLHPDSFIALYFSRARTVIMMFVAWY